MISLENVSQAILALQNMDMDTDTLLQKTKEFFFLLFQEDSFFIIAADESVSDDALQNKAVLPYTAAITPEGDAQYLRLFSHKDAAMQYLSELKLPEKNCIPISSIETVQLAKFWFLRGICGYVLNDGSPWVAISFPDYLQMVFQNLLEAPEMYRQEYVDFILSQLPLSDGELDFHSVQYVNLDFEPDGKPEEQYALLPVQANPEHEAHKNHFRNHFQNIKSFWEKRKKKPKAESGSHKTAYKKLLLPVGLGLAFCIPLSMAGISMLNTRSFSAALENHDFAKAAAIYEKHAGSTYFIKTADGKIIENIEQMITDYAAGRIPIEDIQEQLEDYRQFSGLQDAFAAYAEQVSRLEYSKSAYLSGLVCFEQGNYLQGLSDWTLVVPDDCYYQDVTSMVSQNEKVYKAQGLLQCENYKKSGQTEKYQKGMALLYRWFPHDDSLMQQGSDLQQTPVFVDEDYPIMITDISVSMPNPNMGRDLHIRWTNTSGKSISSITFLVEAVDAFGNPTICNRGGYSLYQAAADGPFANGEGMQENAYWQSAWYNSVIENVNLLGISINYADGSAEEISELAVLEALKK